MQTLVTKTHFLTFALLVTSAFNALAQLGNSSSDLVFTPITPCRIVDTRNAGGMISSLGTRVFNAWAVSYSSQGGNAAGCGLPQSSDVAALVVNLLVISPIGAGWIAAWPNNTPMPVVSNLNFKTGDVLANSAVLKVWPSNGSWSLYTTTTTHFVTDVTGYYSRPTSVGSLECETQSGATTVLANSGVTATKLCSPGFVLTGGGCHDYETDGSLLIAKSRPILPENTGWFCRWQNTSSNDLTAFVDARCCRIPGR
jgi:hypothetical protein